MADFNMFPWLAHPIYFSKQVRYKNWKEQLYVNLEMSCKLLSVAR